MESTNPGLFQSMIQADEADKQLFSKIAIGMTERAVQTAESGGDVERALELSMLEGIKIYRERMKNVFNSMAAPVSIYDIMSYHDPKLEQNLINDRLINDAQKYINAGVLSLEDIIPSKLQQIIQKLTNLPLSVVLRDADGRQTIISNISIDIRGSSNTDTKFPVVWFGTNEPVTIMNPTYVGDTNEDGEKLASLVSYIVPRNQKNKLMTKTDQKTTSVLYATRSPHPTLITDTGDNIVTPGILLYLKPKERVATSLEDSDDDFFK